MLALENEEQLQMIAQVREKNTVLPHSLLLKERRMT
jgi:hypothetical protein